MQCLLAIEVYCIVDFAERRAYLLGPDGAPRDDDQALTLFPGKRVATPSSQPG